jgi:hypothetical protein
MAGTMNRRKNAHAVALSWWGNAVSNAATRRVARANATLGGRPRRGPAPKGATK